MAVEKKMQHSEYMEKTRTMSNSSLRYVISDCKAAIEAGEGWNPNVSYYMDEVHYCSMELRRRELETRNS